jgi:hypothetical protein
LAATTFIGSPATATDRLKFLRQLSQDEDYIRALILLDHAVSVSHFYGSRSNIIGQGDTSTATFIPVTWSRWSYDNSILPTSFYSTVNKRTLTAPPDSVYKWAEWLKSSPWLIRPGKICNRQSMEQILLGLGLALNALDLSGAPGVLEKDARVLVRELAQQLANESKR